MNEWRIVKGVSGVPVRALAVIVLLAASLSACAREPAAAVDSLRADFPIIEALHLSLYFRPDDGICEYLDYSGGKFSSEPGGGSCLYGLDRTGYRPFDEGARRDLDALQAAFWSHGGRLAAVDVAFGPDGRIATGSFSFIGDWLTSYTYEPGHEAMSIHDSWCVEDIDADWYTGWPC